MTKYYSNHNIATNNKKYHYISFNFKDDYVYGNETTAIVIGQMQRFYILNGNHFEKLENMSTLEALKYFQNNKESHNKLSDMFSWKDSIKVIREYENFKNKIK
jgi:hypothetical protein